MSKEVYPDGEIPCGCCGFPMGANSAAANNGQNMELCVHCDEPEHVAYCPKPEHISKKKWQGMSADERYVAEQNATIDKAILAHGGKIKFVPPHISLDGPFRRK